MSEKSTGQGQKITEQMRCQYVHNEKHQPLALWCLDETLKWTVFQDFSRPFPHTIPNLWLVEFCHSCLHVTARLPPHHQPRTFPRLQRKLQGAGGPSEAGARYQTNPSRAGPHYQGSREAKNSSKEGTRERSGPSCGLPLQGKARA